MANARKRVNYIDMLEVDGEKVTESSAIKEKITSFYQGLYSETEHWRPAFNLVNCPTISSDEAWLEREFNEQEVLDSIKLCAMDKAPGPDGYTMGFYQVCWDVLKDDIMKAVQNFHSREYFEKSFNATYVALIPKKNGAKDLRDFRPISLVSSVYKIISKMLTERLKKVVAKLVDTQQMAFIKGRQITDAALIANECVDTRLKGRTPGILCKLDIEKAFDHVNWAFLIRVLKDMGFGAKWLNWISFCISTIKFSILINGSPEGFFSSQRGLRQGDPLSPFLFIIAMEGLNNMLKTASFNGWLRGFKVSNRQGINMEISHLLYADDTLVLCDANVAQLRYLRLIFSLFEAVSGLRINWRKSQVFPINEVPDIRCLAGILGCEVGYLPTTYLGLSLGSKHKAMEIWQGVLERAEKRLARWKSQYLSLGGRVILVNSVLDALPTYVMSLFSLPVKIEKRLDALRRNFIWQGNKNSKFFHLVNWKTLTIPKKEGGLGTRNLRLHNNSLLTKWLWRFNFDKQALWRQVISLKYEQEGHWCTKPVRSPYGVSLWKSIRQQWPFFLDNIGFSIGNGRTTSFWSDNWLGHGPLKELFPDLFGMACNPAITVETSREQQGWNLNFRRFLNDWEIERVVELFKCLEQFQGTNTGQDSLFWKSSSSKIFSVKSAYKILSGNGNQTSSWPWKQIWKPKIPLKVACFTWLVAKNACLTQENLKKRGFLLCSRCHLCQANTESIGHLFLHCVVADHLWQLFLNIIGLKWCMPETPKDLLRCWNNSTGIVKQKKWWSIIPACIWWTLRKERNSRCFEDKSSSTQKIKMRCILLIHYWCKEKDVDDVNSLLDVIESL